MRALNLRRGEAHRHRRPSTFLACHSCWHGDLLPCCHARLASKYYHQAALLSSLAWRGCAAPRVSRADGCLVMSSSIATHRCSSATARALFLGALAMGDKTHAENRREEKAAQYRGEIGACIGRLVGDDRPAVASPVAIASRRNGGAGIKASRFCG